MRVAGALIAVVLASAVPVRGQEPPTSGVGAEARVRSDGFRFTIGTGFKLTVARTWGSPIGTNPGLTYLGPEIDLYVWRVGVNLGVLWRVAGSGGSSALFSWGLGIGL